jgi:hypothetical protein
MTTLMNLGFGTVRDSSERGSVLLERSLAQLPITRATGHLPGEAEGTFR